MFDENKHPRADDGKFTDGTGKTYRQNTSYSEILREDKGKTVTNQKVVTVNLNSDIQKQLSEATTPKERQKIAYRYIMDNLCGKYNTPEGRTVIISSVGADKITHKDIEVKLRVSPHLADFIKAGELESLKDVIHKKFSKFAYYRVTFELGKDKYVGILNVGIREDGSSTLYDLNPFNKK